jgi:hypothetical protein
MRGRHHEQEPSHNQVLAVGSVIIRCARDGQKGYPLQQYIVPEREGDPDTARH